MGMIIQWFLLIKKTFIYIYNITIDLDALLSCPGKLDDSILELISWRTVVAVAHGMPAYFLMMFSSVSFAARFKS